MSVDPIESLLRICLYVCAFGLIGCLVTACIVGAGP